MDRRGSDASTVPHFGDGGQRDDWTARVHELSRAMKREEDGLAANRTGLMRAA